MMHHTLRFTQAPPRAVVISHVKSLGVTLNLSVFEFIPTATDQLEYWYKDAAGWQSMPTTAYAIKRGLNTDILERYVQEHTHYFVETAFQGQPLMSEIFLGAFQYARTSDNFLVRDALQLWTANQLLIKGASLHPGSEDLGVHPIPSLTSPAVGEVPLPRALSNQIDHLLERRIWQLEKQVLTELQKRIFGRKRGDWLKIFFTMVVMMNALERDSWRLYYWIFHMEDGYVWRHPTPPKQLIEKNDALAESLSAHFAAISKGLTPFALDWTREQSMGLIGNCEDVESMLVSIERIGRCLRNPGMLTQPTRPRAKTDLIDHGAYISSVFSAYRQDDERSLDLLYSSKVMIV